MNAIIVPIMPAPVHSHCHCSNSSFWEGFVILLIILYVCYLATVIISRAIAKDIGPEHGYDKKTFVINLIVPFRGWIKAFIGLFKD